MTTAVTEPGLHQHPFAGAEDRAFFGHPRGLGYLFAAEMFWAFAYYGLVTIATLYMSQQLFTPGHVEHVLGFPIYKSLLQGAFGPMTTLALASQTFGLVTSLMYALPIVGGLVGDQLLGQRRTVLLGFLLGATGLWLLVPEQTFLPALACMICGAGLIRSNFIGQIGRLYSLDDTRRTRAFGLYLIAVNIGGLVTPLVCGTLGEKVGWRYGLMAAATGASLALACYLAGLRHMPPDTVRTRKDGSVRAPSLHPGDGRIVIALLLTLVAEMLFSGTYNQAFNIFPVWAKSHVDHRLFGMDFPVTWFSALDGILTIVGTAFAVRVWAWQAKGGREPTEVTRLAVGLVLLIIAFLLLALGVAAGGGGKAALVFPLGFFLFADFCIPWIDTVTTSLFTRTAPRAINTTMIGVYSLSVAGGNFLVGWLGRLYEGMTPFAFWSLHAAICAGGVVYFLIAGPWLKRTLVLREEPA